MRLASAAILIVPAVIAAALSLFAWPAARLAPRDLPVGIAGPPAAPAALTERRGAFAVRRYRDEAAATQGIRQREVYGALVVAPSGPTLLVASGASPVVAQLLQQGLAAPANPQVRDIVPADPQDPRGAAFAASVLPLILAGILSGVLVATARGRLRGQVVVLVATAALAGAAADLIAQGWLGVLSGPWLANTGALALVVLAIGCAAAGLTGLLGRAGILIAVLTMVFIGNPWSGIVTAPELLPRPTGTIGQLLPPGAGGNLLRSTAFFDGEGAGDHLLVLAAWVAGGLLLVALARVSRRSAGP